MVCDCNVCLLRLRHYTASSSSRADATGKSDLQGNVLKRRKRLSGVQIRREVRVQMTLDEYQRLSMRSFKAKPGLTAQESKAMLGSIGLAGEVGECTEPVKKWFFHNKRSADEVRSELYEEIGDVLWYAACLADAFQLSLGDIAQNNIEKLLKRYPEKANGS